MNARTIVESTRTYITNVIRNFRRKPVRIEDVIRREIDNRVQELVSAIAEGSSKVSTTALGFARNATRKRKSPEQNALRHKHSILRSKLVSKDSTITVKDALFQKPRVIKTASDGTTQKSYTLVGSQYNYENIDTYFRVESYFSRSLMRQVETLTRNGFYIVSEEKTYGKIVRAAITNFQTQTKKSMLNIITSISLDLLKYGFFVIEKQWDNSKRQKVLANLRIISPKDVMFAIDDATGMIVGVYENSSSVATLFATVRSSSIIPAENCIIGFITDPGGNVYPEPPSLQLIDDILTLRSFEETVEILSFQYSSPLLHAKVGTPEQPPRPGEIQRITDSIASMAPNGVIVTDYRVSIESIRLQTGIANLIPYIEHFKDRIFIGSGTSGVIVGEGDTANRATSESHDNSLADRCTFLGNVIENALTFQLIADILKANGAPLTDNDGNTLVTFEFNEVTLSKMIERSNNAINLFQANLITQGEARKLLKKPPMGEAEVNDTYLNRVQIPLALVKADATGAFNRTSVQPTNQYGTKGAPGSRKD